MNAPIKFIIIGLSCAFISTAQADLTTSTFQVLLTITKACSVTSGTPITFTPVASTSGRVTAHADISVNCSKDTPYTIGLSPSNDDLNGSGLLAGTLSTNNDKVPYQLAKDTTGTVWGSDVGTSSIIVSSKGTGGPQPFTVYAVVANANFTADSYSDTVTVKLNY